ncbi:MAG TPA: phosphonate ABC transporter ATP-binding protein [Phototrophicaceae bacterium]|nr:phosphonate ABC transporter ATP-binding protein [Phototrophicaceae bacterium]
MSMLEIEDLQVVYPNGTQALKSISLSIEPREVVAIIGRSGAGKSTLLRCINGLQPATSGTVVLDGQDVTRMNERQLRELRRTVGFIWQEYNLIERLPVITNVLTGRLGYNNSIATWLGFFSREDRALAVRNLERVNLLMRANNRADQLSGGEKQRVSIARAMSQQPKILLADEPVASLDPELARQVMGYLAKIAREEGVPTLINIHHVDLAKLYCDRLIGIAQGLVVFDDVPAALDDEALERIYRFDRDEQRLTEVPVSQPNWDRGLSNEVAAGI